LVYDGRYSLGDQFSEMLCMISDYLHLVLHQPEIPPNTGVALHLIEPLGFEMDDRRLRRAGLDYHEFASVKAWPALDDYQQAFPQRRLVAIETSGQAYHTDFKFQSGDTLVLGSETKGLPSAVLHRLSAAHVIRLPMVSGNRSMNLSNAAAVVIYEAWRQLGYAGADN